MIKFKKTIVSLVALVLSACSNQAPPPTKEEPQTQSPTPMQTETPVETPKEKVIGGSNTKLIDKTKNRITNISLAINAVNGKVINTNETFSFNDVVGERSAKKGYKKASALDGNGEKIKEYGGGVCQLSSTIYQACKDANLIIVERHKHSKKVPYAAEGQDAAVSFGTSDFKFKNDRDKPIKIIASQDKNNVYIKIIEVD